MPLPLVIAYHLIWTGYGWWLPNDPRGSMSNCIRCDVLSDFDLEHPVWGGRGWKVFLDTPTDIERTIGYIEKNPVKIGQPLQNWPFVKKYDGWPLHPGHDPDPPYAKRLRKR
jgi:hypothetical protein